MLSLGPKSPVVRLLQGTVASLPAYESLADAPPAFTEVGFRYSRYSEDSIPADRLIFGSGDRYDIDVTQLWIEAPVGARWSVALDLQNDYQTGASPWFVGQALDGSPGVIMSGASIQDNRVEVGVTTRYFWADGNAGFSVSQSKEDDYEALAMAMDVAWNSADNRRTWSASLSRSNDIVEPVQGAIPVFINREDVDTQSGYFGVSQILSKTEIVRVGLSFTLSEGYLTDPYKFVDSRPDEHQRVAWSAGYRRFIVNADAVLQADYRYYNDDWGIDSHTLELAWTQNLRAATVTPYLRYYTQRAADFFSVTPDRDTLYFADDYRLAAFGALTAGLRGTYAMRNWRFEAQLERYRSDNDWGIFGGDTAPALVEFWRGTLGLTWQFD